MMKEFTEKINEQLDELKKLRAIGLSTTKEVIGESLFKQDLYSISLQDRCIRLNDGFVKMIETRNLCCAGILLRSQLDNCMRLFAYYIAADKEKVVNSLFDPSIKIGSLKDIYGNRMTDSNLSEKLVKYDSRFRNVYVQASGYVHHSEKSFYGMNTKIENLTLRLGIGADLSEEYDEILFECIEAFVHYVKFQYWLIDPVIQSKKRFDLNDNEE